MNKLHLMTCTVTQSGKKKVKCGNKGFLFFSLFLKAFTSTNVFISSMCILRTCYPPDLSAGENESRIFPNPCRSCREKPGEKLRDDTAQERWQKPLSQPRTSRHRSITQPLTNIFNKLFIFIISGKYPGFLL